MKLAIRNARVIDPATRLDAPRDLYVAAGRIVGIVEPGKSGGDFTPNRTIDASGLVACPGLIDLSARLREPGSEYRATLESEIDAALAGGVTSLVCPPDTDPPLDEPGLVEMLKHRARTLNRTHVHPLGALTMGLKGVALTEMSELHDAGCVGFSQANLPIADTQVLLRALQYAQTFGFTVWLRPQDAFLGRGGVAASGPVSARLGLPSIPVTNETVALLTIFELLRSFGSEGSASAAPRVHLCRLSSSGGIALVRAAKAEGLPITCDVGVHHVHLTDMDIGFFDAQCRLDPPLRGQRDRAAIRSALADGTIDAICSDHTPVDDDAKLLPFEEAEPGTTGLELLLPLVLKWADESQLPLADALAKVTQHAAAIVTGLTASALASTPTGRIEIGGAADLCFFDPEKRWLLEPSALKSQGKNTPFIGYEMKGKVRITMVGGTVVHEDRT